MSDATPAAENDVLAWGDMPYDHKTPAQVVHDYVMVRGDLSDPHARDQLALWIERYAAHAAAEAVRTAAEEHVAELVCCDVYDRLREKPSGEWTDEDRAEYRGHSICYWGAACAEGDRGRAARIDRDLLNHRDGAGQGSPS